MTKVIVLVLVVVLVLWLMKGRSARKRADRAQPPRAADNPGAPQPMVSCAHCGLHLPRAEALLLGDQPFCCAAHRDAGARRR